MFTTSLIVAAFAGLASAAPEADRVTSLPEMTTFDQYGVYSGYLPIEDTAKRLHYMFVESQNEPSTDPLIVWFNGGPGCSSMLGWAQEHGPWVMENGGTEFHENEYSWNKEANMLYIEAPAGVGFSYCEGFKDCTFTDDTSAEDNLAALLAWYGMFPEFGEHDMYISGESYAGIYVPYLSHAVVTYNEEHADDDMFKPNLQGFMVGNGVTNWDLDCNVAYVEMGYYHSLYETDLYDKIHAANCDFGGPYMQKATPECMEYFNQFNTDVEDDNIYDIYGICWGLGPYPQMIEGGHKKKEYSYLDYTPFLRNPAQAANELPPCTFGNPVAEYMNRDDVREALHIPVEYKEWELCTSDIHYVIGTKGSQWIYEDLLGKIRMIHYSGDTDGAVPTLGTQSWIATTDFVGDEAWRPYFVDGQVAGYLESYEGGFTFGTVHGAGHMAPQFKRPETYHLIFNWINETAI